MKNFPRWLALGLCLLALGQFARAADAPRQTPLVLERNAKVTFKYLLYLPKDYATQQAWPLVLFLHGAGERGDDLDMLKKHGPPKLIETGKDFPFLVVSPQCPKGKWWEPMELATLLDEITEKYKIDPDRIYVTGLSMGGFGTWSLAAYQPTRFAALVPICGGGDPIWAHRISTVPAWVFHGGKDPTVPLARSQTMVDALKKLGSPVKFTIYPEAGHDSWTQAYDDPELYTWLLQQKRPAGAAPTGKSLTFDTHDGYFVSNKFEPAAPTSFVVLNDQKAFDDVFGAGFVMHDKSHRLSPNAFATQMVVAAIHRGKALWEYKVEGVTTRDHKLIVQYTAKSTPQASAEYACPLIVSLPKADYAGVEFVENGAVIATK